MLQCVRGEDGGAAVTDPRWPYWDLVDRGWQPRGWAGPEADLEVLPFRWFTEAHLLGEGGAAWRWEPWQLTDIIAPMFERYQRVTLDNGLICTRPEFNHALLMMAKKNGKTTIGSIVAQWALAAKANALILVAAATEDNARVLGRFMIDSVRRSPFMMSLVTDAGIYRDGTIEIKNGPTSGSVMRIVAGPRGADALHGEMYDLCIGDEVWTWEGEAGEAMAEALTLPPERLQDCYCPLTWWTTYPGKHPTLSRVLARTMTAAAEGALPRVYLKHYTARDRDDWRSANPSSRVTEEYLAQQEGKLLPAQFDRLHLCCWARQDSSRFVTAAQVAACTDAGREPTISGSTAYSYLMACDLGLRHDRTCIAVGHIDYDQEPPLLILDEMRGYLPPPGGTLSVEFIHQELLARAERYWCERIAIDPYQMIGTIQALRSRGLDVEEFTFSAGSMRRLTERLYTRLAQGSVRLYPQAGLLTTAQGTPHDLQSELVALVLKPTDYGYRLDHGSGREAFSDLSVTLGMLVDLAEEQLGLGQPAVYAVGES